MTLNVPKIVGNFFTIFTITIFLPTNVELMWYWILNIQDSRSSIQYLQIYTSVQTFVGYLNTYYTEIALETIHSTKRVAINN